MPGIHHMINTDFYSLILRGPAVHPLLLLVRCTLCCVLLLQVGPDGLLDVWLQLLERCAEDSACLPGIIRSLPRQQQRVTDLQQQLAEQQQQQQHIVLLQQQMPGLQQQLAGQRQGRAQQQPHAELQEH